SYGQPTLLDGTLTPLVNSAIGNRYLFTAREWDDAAGLYQFRYRWLSATLGRFLSQDPEQYIDGASLYRAYFVPGLIDPSGTDCTYSICSSPVAGTAGHLFAIIGDKAFRGGPSKNAPGSGSSESGDSNIAN